MSWNGKTKHGRTKEGEKNPVSKNKLLGFFEEETEKK